MPPFERSVSPFPSHRCMTGRKLGRASDFICFDKCNFASSPSFYVCQKNRLLLSRRFAAIDLEVFVSSSVVLLHRETRGCGVTNAKAIKYIFCTRLSSSFSFFSVTIFSSTNLLHYIAGRLITSNILPSTNSIMLKDRISDCSSGIGKWVK